MTFKSGFIALLGRPNVGKSTLINRLVGQKIAIASPVAQTTRHRIKGVVTQPNGQAIFLDTPGFSKPIDKLGGYLTDESLAAVNEADAFILVVDASVPPGKGDAWVAEKIRETDKFVLLVLNKCDVHKNKPEIFKQHYKMYANLLEGYKNQDIMTVSAKTGKNVSRIIDTVLQYLPEGPAYFPEDEVTDQRMREMTAEIVREQVLLQTREEIPHSVAVGIDDFDESDPELTRISATLYVDQKSQKGILIGMGGSMIKSIGSAARPIIEEMLEMRIHLALQVKTKENWRKDNAFLKTLGLAPPSK
jgi:GTP-binding protein Era